MVLRLRCQMSVGFVWSCCGGCRGSCYGWALLTVGGVTLWVPESGLGTGFSLWGCVILSLGMCGSLSVGLGHPGQWGVLVSDCVDLVWVQDLPSGVVLISGCLSLVPAPGSLSGVV